MILLSRLVPVLNDTHWLLQFIYQLLHVSLCLTIKDKKVIFPISPQLTHLKFIFNILFFSFCVIFDLIKLIQKFESDFILSHVIAKVRSLAVGFSVRAYCHLQYKTK